MVRHMRDQIVLEPFDRLRGRKLVNLRGIDPHIDGAGHQRHAARFGRVALLGHHRDSGERLHAGLTDREHMRPRPDKLKAANDVVDIIVEAEGPFFQRHVAGIFPVGDIDLVIAHQRAHRLAQQRREMARERRHDQHFRLRRSAFLAEADEIAEGQRGDHLLMHRHGLAIDQRAFDAIIRPRVRESGAADQFQRRHVVLAESDFADAGKQRAQAQASAGHHADRFRGFRVSLISAVQHVLQG